MRARFLPAALACALAALLGSAGAARAQLTPTLEPGDTLRFVGADFDHATTGTCDGTLTECYASPGDLGVESVRTYVATSIAVGAGFQTVTSTARLIGSFRISGDNGHRIGAKLGGTARWRGWLLADFGAWDNNSTVDVAVAIYDVTTATQASDLYDQLVARQTLYTNSVAGKIGATPTFERGIGTGSFNLAVDLYRGHEYFAVLEARCTSSSGLLGVSTSSSFSEEVFAASPLDDGFVERTRMILRTEYDWLEMIEDLRDEFRGHRHEYLTGRGEGHNNTEAETSAPLDSADAAAGAFRRPAASLLGPAHEVPGSAPDAASVAGGPPRLELAGALPNPSLDGLAVRFALPDAAPAALELFDVSGRRLAAHDVGGRGAGVHTLRLAERGELPAGVYLVRLTRGGESLSSRLSVMR